MAFFKKQFFYTGSLCFLTLTQNVSRKKNVFLRYFFSSSEWKKKKVKSFVFVLFSGFICLFIQDFFFYYKTFFSQEFCVYFSVDKNKFNSVLHKKYEKWKNRRNIFSPDFSSYCVKKKKWKSLKYIFSAKLNVLYLFSHMKKKRVFLSVWVKKNYYYITKSDFC